MERAWRPERLTATGNVVSAPLGGIAKIILTPAAVAAQLDVRQGGSGGTIILSLQVAANGNSFQSDAFRFEGQLHVTLTGAGASVTALT